MKKLWIFIFCIFIANSAYGFDIVYPKNNNITKKTPTTFFIGASKKPVKINGQNIKLHPTGGFAYFVNLKNGVNTFTFESEDKKETYTITRLVNRGKITPPKLIDYNTDKYFIVTKDKSPLRSTPVDAGINRLAHLQEGVLLTSNGEKGNFYRIKLNNKFGWINKNNVKETEKYTLAKLKNYDFKNTEDNYIFTFHLDKKVPYEITEGETITLKFYNTDKEHFFDFPYKRKTGTDKLFGYYGEYKDNDFILKIRKPPEINNKKPLKNIKIVVDPGHGGKETGATGCLGDKEKDIVLKISKHLEHELKSRGAKVIMTREHDKNVGLNERIDIANKNDAVIFVSIHNNALPDTLNPNEHRGTSIFYYYNQAKPLAETVLKTMTEELETQNDNIHQQSFAVVRNTGALSILIEVAYLINPYDNEMLINHDFQKNTAKSIANGLEKYLTK